MTDTTKGKKNLLHSCLGFVQPTLSCPFHTAQEALLHAVQLPEKKAL